MKSILILIFVLSVNSFFCQKVNLKEEAQSFSVGSKNAFTLSIPFADNSFVEENLKSYLKDFGKLRNEKNEFIVKLGKNKDLGEKPFDIYAKIISSTDELTILAFSFDLGGAFLNSKDHASQTNIIEKSLLVFGKDCAEGFVNSQLKTENKTLKQEEKEHEDLVNNSSDLQQSIKEYKQKISEAENNIAENNSKLEKKKGAIKNQKIKIQEIENKKRMLQ